MEMEYLVEQDGLKKKNSLRLLTVRSVALSLECNSSKSPSILCVQLSVAAIWIIILPCWAGKPLHVVWSITVSGNERDQSV